MNFEHLITIITDTHPQLQQSVAKAVPPKKNKLSP